MSRYAPLTAFLKEQVADRVQVSFADVERVIGRKLPESASTHRAWWSNNAANNVMTRAWLAAGFQSEQVDLPGQKLVFRRKTEGSAMSGFAEAQMASKPETRSAPDKPALFGCMKGTITFVPGVDLTEPADPDLGAYLDGKYGSDDPSA